MSELLLQGLDQYGYAAIFAFVFLQEVGFPSPIPNEYVLLFSGFLSSTGLLHLGLVIGVVVGADLLAGLLLYELFLRAGTLISRKRPAWLGNTATLAILIKPPFWKTTVAYGFYVLIAMAIVIGFLLTSRRKIREKEKAKLEVIHHEKQQELLTAKISFFTNITHEIRTPLTLIMGSLNRFKKSDKAVLSDNEDLAILTKNTQRLLNLVNQLLDFRKIESSSFLMNFLKLDFKQLIEDTFTRFTPIAKTKNVQFSLHLPDSDCFIIADKESLTKILSNLLSNALKFCDSMVDVSLEEVDAEPHHVARLRVNNDGEPIPEEVTEDIFKPFFQSYGDHSKAPMNGSGLGLPLAKSLAEMHSGSLYLDRDVTACTSFVFELPLEQASTCETEVPAPVFTTKPFTLNEPNPEASKHKHNLLIVDDEVELRLFVLEELSPFYTIYSANNGMEALSILEEQTISLVVSDLMMPVMDGLALCNAIKTNIKFCHIPVIVLTAKASLQAHIDALESKADAYIEKPFSTDHLLAQIDNLLANREIMRSTFVRSPHAHLVSVASNAIDEAFVNKMNDFVMNHLDDTRLSVETVAECMSMSVSTLYRKVKTMTSLAPNDFIRLCRLKKAAELLTNRSYRINEVAELVGFSTTSYFTACFMKQFGMTPSDFVKTIDRSKG